MSLTREQKRVLETQLYEDMRRIAQTTTEWTERLAGQLVNHTLDVRTDIFPAAGYLSYDYAVAAGSVKVRNLGAAGHNVTVVSGGAVGPAVPSNGVGVWVVPSGVTDVVPLAARQLTLFGTTGDFVCLQVFTGAVRPVTSS